jgi:hypothetical protein
MAICTGRQLDDISSYFMSISRGASNFTLLYCFAKCETVKHMCDIFPLVAS